MYQKTKYLVSGDKAITIEFGNIISDIINHRIRVMSIAIEESNIKGITETVPTYRSLMVHYDPIVINFSELIIELKKLEHNLNCTKIPNPKVVEIPTLYGNEFGPDLEYVAKHNNLTIKEVIEIHASREYLIYMLGFTPGFPYLGGVDSRIATPRLNQPRTKIPKGSVGIAGNQTGIYSLESPGGWQLIGRTPLDIFNPDREDPILLKAGYYIKFRSINEVEFIKIKNAVDKGIYKYKIYTKEDWSKNNVTD